MDLHTAANGYPLQQHSTPSSPSIQFHHFQQPRHSQLYNLLPPSITLPPISNTYSNERSRDQVYNPHIKRETTMVKHVDASKTQDDPMPSTSDFVKKLYKMLEDPEFQNVVSWGPLGDCFVVKDMNEFTKSILPRMFKHSNFASFVRQLNKYDFHKVKNTDDNPFGEQTWTFRHPDFHADRREALENIKRKVPAQRKTANLPSSTTTSLSTNHYSSSSPSIHHTHSHHHHTSSPYPTNRRSPSPSHSYLATTTTPHHLKQELTHLKSHLLSLESNFDSRLSNIQSAYESRIHSLESAYENRFRGLEKNYQCVLVELAAFHNGVAQQDAVLKSLIRGFLGEDGKQQRASSSAMLMNHQQTTASTAGYLLPTTTMEDRLGTYRRHQLDQQRSQDHNPSQSQSQPSSSSAEAPSSSRSDRTVVSPQNTRISGHTSTNSTATTASTPTLASAPPPTRNGIVDRTPQDHDQQRISQQTAALAQMVEYHRESLVRSLGEMRNAGGVDERVVDDEDEDEERGRTRTRTRSGRRERRRGSKAEYTLGGKTSNQQDQRRFSQPTASSSNNNFGRFKAGEGDGDEDDEEEEDLRNTNEGLQVYTVGHLVPRDMGAGGEDVGNCWNFDSNSGFNGGANANSYQSAAGAVSSEAVDTLDGDDDEDVEIIPPPGMHPCPSKSTPTITSTPVPPSSLPQPAVPTTTITTTPTSTSSSSTSHQTLRVRRATFVPGWAVPPRVLLVDDDAVIRKLSSKFLKIFGCTTDVAVDGIGAVMKMNLEKYDLVLMDILMPKLDGISATNLIRKFDRGTPIISMTGNSKPDEIMEYYSSGMNDILPKPFTKEGLLGMLEKHLMHLKVMHQMTVIPRSVGVPPLSDANFEQVLMTNAMIVQQQQQQMQQGQPAAPVAGLANNTADDTSNTLSSPIPPPPPSSQPPQLQQPSQLSFTSLLTMGEDDERINNPLAGMGLSDDHYNMILQNLVNGERFMGMGMDGGASGAAGGSGSSDSAGVGGGRTKRSIDDVGFVSNERGGKRSRFEVVE